MNPARLFLSRWKVGPNLANDPVGGALKNSFGCGESLRTWITHYLRKMIMLDYYFYGTKSNEDNKVVFGSYKTIIYISLMEK